jgi:hypothetical protein
MGSWLGSLASQLIAVVVALAPAQRTLIVRMIARSLQVLSRKRYGIINAEDLTIVINTKDRTIGINTEDRTIRLTKSNGQ